MANRLVEQTAKRSEALESNFKANICDSGIPEAQQLFRLLYATFDQILVWSFIERLPEKTQEVVARKTRLTGNLVEIQRQIVTKINEVASATEPRVNVWCGKT